MRYTKNQYKIILGWLDRAADSCSAKMHDSVSGLISARSRIDHINRHKDLIHRKIMHMGIPCNFRVMVTVLCQTYWIFYPSATEIVKDVTCPYCIELINNLSGGEYEIR